MIKVETLDVRGWNLKRLAKDLLHDNQSSHRLHDRYSPRDDTWIVSTFGG